MGRNQAAIDAATDRFVADFARLLTLAGNKAETVALDVVQIIGASLVNYSPVGNPTLWKHPAPKGYAGGRFRGNWQHGFNIRPAGTLSAIDAGGESTIARLAAQVQATRGHGGVHYFVNNLPYANRLEYDQHSSQAPSGMVGITQVEFHSYVEQQAAKALARGVTP